MDGGDLPWIGEGVPTLDGKRVTTLGGERVPTSDGVGGMYLGRGGGTYTVWGKGHLPWMGVPTLDWGGVPMILPWMGRGTYLGWEGALILNRGGVPTLDWGVPILDGEGLSTLDGVGGTYAGWGRLATLDGGIYPRWGEGYLPWTGGRVPTLDGGGVPTVDGGVIYPG